VVRPPPVSAIKTEGTKRAVLRSILVAQGGFDPAYHFFLDETDLNMRLARAGYATALVPRAQVHHGFAPSPRRRADRAPQDLYDIGASWAVFQRKFIPEAEHVAHWTTLHRAERQRALRHMVAGRLEPRDVRRLMTRLQAGYKDGQTRPFGRADLPAHSAVPFQKMPKALGDARVITARPWGVRRARAAARAAVKDGAIVTLLILSPSGLYHHARFHPDGYWEQRGGQFGKSVRAAPLLRWVGFQARARMETNRIEKIRTP